MTNQELANAIREIFPDVDNANVNREEFWIQVNAFCDRYPEWKPKWGDKVRTKGVLEIYTFVGVNPLNPKQGFVTIRRSENSHSHSVLLTELEPVSETTHTVDLNTIIAQITETIYRHDMTLHDFMTDGAADKLVDPELRDLWLIWGSAL